MRSFFRVERSDLIAFVVCAIIYVLIVMGWNLSGVADSDMATIRSLPLIGDLPPQSISKFVLTVALYLMSLIYALLAIALSDYRRALPLLAIIGVVTFLAWSALNFWVISGFLNSPSTLVYGGLSLILLLGWIVGVMFFVSRLHDPMAAFMVRFGLGASMFITIVQLVALLTPDWRSPTQGVPVLYTLTLNAMVGLFVAGVGGNMLWRERRAEVLAGGRRKR